MDGKKARAKRVKWLASVGVAALFAWAIWGLYQSGPTATVGQPAPAFSLPTPTGGTVNLAQYRGKVVLLNFWASWCVPCQQEIPDLIAFQRQAGPDLTIIGIDRMEPPQLVEQFVRQEGMTYPIGLDRNGALSQRYGVTGQPESFWIDPQGVLRLHDVGPMSPGHMRATFDALKGGG